MSLFSFRKLIKNMTIIPIKNGTHYITIDCASLTRLEYDPDTNIYRCEFSDWAFGLFAILAVLLLLVPVVLIIHCCLKWYHKNQARHFHPSFSTRTSYSSLHPHEGNLERNLENVLNEVNSVFFHCITRKYG